MSLGPHTISILTYHTPVLIIQSVGVILLMKRGRNAEWWLMLVATILRTIWCIAYPVTMDFMGMTSSKHYTPVTSAFMTLGLTSSVMFVTGFAIHAARSGRHHERITELELMNLAQATELERLRNR